MKSQRCHQGYLSLRLDGLLLRWRVMNSSPYECVVVFLSDCHWRSHGIPNINKSWEEKDILYNRNVYFLAYLSCSIHSMSCNPSDLYWDHLADKQLRNHWCNEGCVQVAISAWSKISGAWPSLWTLASISIILLLLVPQLYTSATLTEMTPNNERHISPGKIDNCVPVKCCFHICPLWE